MSDSDENKKVLVAIDDGYAEIKVLHKLSETPFVKPLYAREVNINSLLEDKFGVYKIKDKYFFVSEFEGKEKLLGEGSGNSHYSLENLAIIHHALVLSGLQDKEVQLSAGLPLDQFFNISEDGLSANNETINRKLEILKTPVEYIDKKTQQNEIVEARVFPQSFLAISQIIDCLKEKGNSSSNERLTLVDIGGGTTDISTFQIEANKITAVIPTQSTTINVGVDRVIDRTIELYKKATKADLSGHRGEIHRAIRNHEFIINGYFKKMDFSDSYINAIPHVKKKIIDKLVEIDSKSPVMNNYIFIGGGSKVFSFKEDMEKIGLNMVELSQIDQNLDPQLLNVSMFYKFYTR